MIADHQTNVVYVADTLERRFPAVYGGLKTILSEHGIPFRTIPGTRDVWCRDYMPVQVAEDRFVQFRYAPNYLTGKYRHLRADGEIGPLLPFIKNCVKSEIVLDGGNLVRWKDVVIVTNKIFAENPSWDRRDLECELRKLLEVEKLIFIPTEPGDLLGHSDGVVRFVDAHTVLVNSKGVLKTRYQEVLYKRLVDKGLSLAKIPCLYVTATKKGIPSAIGCYVNYHNVAQLVIVPSFGIPEDEKAFGVVSQNSRGASVKTLDCRRLARHGGVLNCISWNMLDMQV